MKHLIQLIAIVFLSVQVVYGQRVKNEKITYTFVNLPLHPLPKEIKNYQTAIFPVFEAEEEAKKKEVAKQRKDAYDQQVKVYREKQQKGEATGPAPQMVIYPEKTKPKLDGPALAAKFLYLDGYKSAPENALKIEVTLLGYKHSPGKEVVVVDQGITYYHVEFDYMYDMTAKILGPDGKEIMNIVPADFKVFKKYSSQISTVREISDPTNYPNFLETKIMEQNLTRINELINDEIGYRKINRVVLLNYVKDKNGEYSDLTSAYELCSDGYKLLLSNETEAKKKISSAVEKWNNSLKESSLTDKKARIDKDISIAIYFNLIESYLILRDPVNAQKNLDMVRSLYESLNSYEKSEYQNYLVWIKGLQERLASNK